MKFKKGQSGNPSGRVAGHGNGRIRALATLDRVLARSAVQEVIARALADAIKENPVGFFKTVIMPLLPREAQLSLEKSGVVRWRSLIEGDAVGRVEGADGGVGVTAAVGVDGKPVGVVRKE